MTFGQEIKTTKNFSFKVSTPYEVIDGTKYTFGFEEDVVGVKLSKNTMFLQLFEGNKLEETKRVSTENFLANKSVTGSKNSTTQ